LHAARNSFDHLKIDRDYSIGYLQQEEKSLESVELMDERIRLELTLGISYIRSAACLILEFYIFLIHSQGIPGIHAF